MQHENGVTDLARPKATNPRLNAANVRLTDSERLEMEAAAERAGFGSISEYIRHLHRAATAPKTVCEEQGTSLPPSKLYFSTQLGEIYNGNALSVMSEVMADRSVDLIVTSPPFGLVRKKSYGNEDADSYCDWFRPFAREFKRVLKDNGSLVIDIGGAWKPGLPVRSLYHFELLIMLCREFGFYLCQEHYWWNPSKLPTPAEWVNVRRIRVKDAVNTVWWLSPSPYPRANNRRVLAPYSESMKSLLKNGYKAKLRPSGHDISDKFSRDNGGSVPPNLLAIANTESNGVYQEYCRQNGLPVHPARFPSTLPEYFVRFLTNAGDVVYDPFGGSCVTAEVCERLGRRWITSELNEEFLKGALSRFQPKGEVASNPKAYEIYPPCSGPMNEAEKVFDDGGCARPPLKILGQAAE